jgi:glycosyltransferase involved in cell wall biosynthesis
LRILTVVVNLGKGGVQRTAQNFAEAYSELGHESVLLAGSASGGREKELEGGSVRIVDGRQPAWLERVREWQPEMIHLHSHGLDAELVSEVFNAARRATVIEKNVFSRPSEWSRHLVLSHQMSRWGLRLYLDRMSIGDAPPSVVPNPCNVERFYPESRAAIDRFRTNHSIPEDALVMGRIGQNYETKWSSLLMDVFEVRAANRPSLHLLLVNPPPSIVARVNSSGVSNRVRIIDEIRDDSELRLTYGAMDVFAHCSDRGESFGNVLVESMLCGTAVATLSTPWADNAQSEVIESGVTGLVARDTQTFFACVDRLLADPDLREQLGRDGRSTALARYDRLRVAQSAIDSVNADPVPADAAASLAELWMRANGPDSFSTSFLLRHSKLRRFTRFSTGYRAPIPTLIGQAKLIVKRKLRG